MRGRQTTRSGLGPIGLLLVGGAVLLAGGGGTVATLASLGYLPFKPAAIENHEGQVACIVLNRPMTAFAKITRPDLADPKTGGLSVLWIDEKSVDSSMLRHPGDVLGRVLARDKAPNYIFTEKDFLPKGSREGVAGGVPAGKLAMSVDPTRIRGLDVLKSGDRFDVLAATSLDATSANGPATKTPLVIDPSKPLPKASGPKPKQVAVQVLITNGSLVTIKDATHKEATIAIDPPEITPLTKALATDDNLFCVVRSGRADAGEEASVTPDVSCVVLSRRLAAYSRVAPADLIEEKTGQPALLWFAAEDVDPKWLKASSDVIGRVLARDKSPGELFTEEDFMPEGTLAGTTSGVPAGKRAITVEATKIRGIQSMQSGDRFDLLASVSVDQAGVKDRRESGGSKPVSVQTLVKNGTLVAREGSGHDVTLAIDADEIPPLTKALSAGADLLCLARSRQPTDDENHVQSDVPLILAGRPLSALSKVTQEDLTDSKTGRLSVIWVAPGEVDSKWLQSPSDVLGRVLARDKTAGQLFTDEDFLPEGTKEGVAGGVPAGKMAIVVETAKIRGLHVLEFGNRFDLLAGVPVDIQSRLPQLGSVAGNASSEKLLAALKKQSTVNALVQNGTFVTRSPSRNEATLAVDPEEVSRLTKALAAGIDIICVARSSLDRIDDQTVIPPDEDPLKRVTVIETMKGKSRSTELFLQPVISQPVIPNAPQPH